MKPFRIICPGPDYRLAAYNFLEGLGYGPEYSVAASELIIEPNGLRLDFLRAPSSAIAEEFDLMKDHDRECWREYAKAHYSWNEWRKLERPNIPSLSAYVRIQAAMAMGYDVADKTLGKTVSTGLIHDGRFYIRMREGGIYPVAGVYDYHYDNLGWGTFLAQNKLVWIDETKSLEAKIQSKEEWVPLDSIDADIVLSKFSKDAILDHLKKR